MEFKLSKPRHTNLTSTSSFDVEVIAGDLKTLLKPELLTWLEEQQFEFYLRAERVIVHHWLGILFKKMVPPPADDKTIGVIRLDIFLGLDDPYQAMMFKLTWL